MACKGRVKAFSAPSLGLRLNRQRMRHRATAVHAKMSSLVFDCDGVILESEDLHRRAYNASFEHFDVKCNGQLVNWDVEFYDRLQNTVGGGKPKMRWYFGENGWPTSTLFDTPPKSKEDQATLIDTLQDWKSEKYRDFIGSGEVLARPGVLRLMDEARAAGLKLAVCSAATKSSVIFTLENLLGKERFESLDCFLAGDDVDKKKPDPMIYNLALERLGVQPEECVVVEDSSIGLEAATKAGMRCIVTYTGSTRMQPFRSAERIVKELGDDPVLVTVEQLQQGDIREDDRVNVDVADDPVTFR